MGQVTVSNRNNDKGSDSHGDGGELIRRKLVIAFFYAGSNDDEGGG